MTINKINRTGIFSYNKTSKYESLQYLPFKDKQVLVYTPANSKYLLVPGFYEDKRDNDYIVKPINPYEIGFIEKKIITEYNLDNNSKKIIFWDGK